MTTLTKLEPVAPPAQTKAEINAANGCEICAFVVKHHWNGPVAGGKGSHCRDCCRTWTSKSEGHCAVCCAHFSTTRAFDMHFGRNGEHLDPATATRRDGKPTFVARVRPGGTTWAVAHYGKIPVNFGRKSTTTDAAQDENTETRVSE